MSFEKKYLKYKQKYINLKVQLGGDVHPQYPKDEDKNYLVTAINPVKYKYWDGFGEVNWVSPSTEKYDSNIYFKGEKQDNIENMLIHDYPTMHHSVGTLVHSHSDNISVWNIWEFQNMAIINKLSNINYKNRKYKLNPYDFMIVDNKNIVDCDTIIIMGKTIKENNKNFKIWKDWFERNERKIEYFDNTLNDFIEISDTKDAVINEDLAKKKYDKIIDSLGLPKAEYESKFSDYIAKTKKILNMVKATITTNGYSFFDNNVVSLVPILFQEVFVQLVGFDLTLLQNLNTKILAPFIFKETLRNKIDEVLYSKLTGPGDYYNKTIYCTQTDFNNNFPNPQCLRIIEQGTTEFCQTSQVLNSKCKDYQLDSDGEDGEKSIYGAHKGSLLDMQNDKRILIKLKFTLKDGDLNQADKDRLNVIIEQLHNVITRKEYPVKLKEDTVGSIIHDEILTYFNNKEASNFSLEDQKIIREKIIDQIKISLIKIKRYESFLQRKKIREEQGKSDMRVRDADPRGDRLTYQKNVSIIKD